jgi:hypothetical protein
MYILSCSGRAAGAGENLALIFMINKENAAIAS